MQGLTIRPTASSKTLFLAFEPFMLWRPTHLADFDKYTRANWDGHGAKAIPVAVLSKARSFLAATSLPTADAAPGIDGSVGLLWRSSRAYLYLDFKRDGRVHWYIDMQRKGHPREGVLPRAAVATKLIRKVQEAIDALSTHLVGIAPRQTGGIALIHPTQTSALVAPA
jgi:hypothetical protein